MNWQKDRYGWYHGVLVPSSNLFYNGYVNQLWSKSVAMRVGTDFLNILSQPWRANPEKQVFSFLMAVTKEALVLEGAGQELLSRREARLSGFPSTRASMRTGELERNKASMQIVLNQESGVSPSSLFVS